MELKRQKSVMQLERYKEMKARKKELGQVILTTPALEIQLETESKKVRKNPLLNDNEGIGARSCMREEPTLKVTAETDNSLGLTDIIEQKEDNSTSMNEQSMIEK